MKNLVYVYENQYLTYAWMIPLAAFVSWVVSRMFLMVYGRRMDKLRHTDTGKKVGSNSGTAAFIDYFQAIIIISAMAVQGYEIILGILILKSVLEIKEINVRIRKSKYETRYFVVDFTLNIAFAILVFFAMEYVIRFVLPVIHT